MTQIAVNVLRRTQEVTQALGVHALEAEPLQIGGLQQLVQGPANQLQPAAQGQGQRSLHGVTLGQPLQLLAAIELAEERGQRARLGARVLRPLRVLQTAPGQLAVAGDGRLGLAHQVTQPAHGASCAGCG